MILVAAICDPACNHGNCTAPNQCACDNGWKGQTCQVGMFTLLHAYARCSMTVKSLFTITSEVLFDLQQSVTPLAITVTALLLVSVHVMKDGMEKPANYVCSSNFEKSTLVPSYGCYNPFCSLCYFVLFPAICNPPCVHGDCVAPNQCTCDNGPRWKGQTCELGMFMQF